MELFSPAAAPFVIALMLMTLIALLELAGLLFGVAFSGLVDGLLPEADAGAEIDASADGVGKALAWLYVGKAPMLIVFAAFLAGFGASGLLFQSLADSTLGAPLPMILAAPAAFIAALPVTRLLAGAVARFMPQEESDAVSQNAFIGRMATLIRGEARQGSPAEAKLSDGHGKTHYILVEPAEAGAVFNAGDQFLIVEKKGAAFLGTTAGAAALLRNGEGDKHV